MSLEVANHEADMLGLFLWCSCGDLEDVHVLLSHGCLVACWLVAVETHSSCPQYLTSSRDTMFPFQHNHHNDFRFDWIGMHCVPEHQTVESVKIFSSLGDLCDIPWNIGTFVIVFKVQKRNLTNCWSIQRFQRIQLFVLRKKCVLEEHWLPPPACDD